MPSRKPKPETLWQKTLRIHIEQNIPIEHARQVARAGAFLEAKMARRKQELDNKD